MSEMLHHAVNVVLHGWNRELRWLIAICLLVIGCVVAWIVRDMARTPTPGVTDHEIRLGSSLPLEGPTSRLGKEYGAGVTTAIEMANRHGGVNGRLVRLIVRNDNYEPLKCVLNTRDFIETDNVFALTSYVGTPTSIKAQPIWTGAQVPIVGFFTGAQALRDPFNHFNFHIRPSYLAESHALTDLLVDQLKVKRVAVFYQYDSFGLSVLRDLRKILSQHNARIVAEGSYLRNTSDIETALKIILEAKPDGVIMVGTYMPVARFVKEMRLNSKKPVYFAMSSFVGADAFIQEVGKDGEGCFISQVVPLCSDTKVAAVQDFIRDFHAVCPDQQPSSASLEGYLNGRILIEGLRRAGRNLTREKFISALESIHGEILGTGLNFSYGPEDHEGIEPVYMSRIKNGRLEYINAKN